MMGEEALTPAQHKLLRVIKASSEELLDLTRHLLQASHVESGRRVLEEREFDPRELLRLQLAGISACGGSRALALARDRRATARTANRGRARASRSRCNCASRGVLARRRPRGAALAVASRCRALIMNTPRLVRPATSRIV
jgi:signal transduction histidine kinase